MENSEEMFILSKYKYIRYLAKAAESQVKATITASVTIPKAIPTVQAARITTEEAAGKSAKEVEKELKDQKTAEKMRKKELMKQMCQPSEKKEKKVKFVEKEKFVCETPHGEKKGKGNY